jgi:hypothetical protein
VPRAAQSDGPSRVEASAFRGRPAAFALIYPWTTPTRDLGTIRTTSQRVGNLVGVLVLAALIVTAALVARHNLRLDRADWSGALRLAGVVMALWVFVWVVEEHHVASIWELYLAMSAAGFTLLAGALIGTFYLALEPHVRRTRPGMIVSWSRLVAGNLRDPLAAGVIYSIEGGSYLVAERGTGAVPLLIAPAAARVFRGGVYVASALATILVTSILSSLLNLFLLVVLRRLLRYEWAAVLAAATLIGVSVALESATLSIRLPAAVLSSAALFTLISRAGLVATIAASAVLTVLQSYPVTWPLTAWYSKGGLVGLIATSALAVAAFRMTTAPRETRQRGD